MAENKILYFKGKNVFLSNFYECTFEYNGITWESSEAAFQAQKSTNPRTQSKVSKLSASDSKKACGRRGLRGFQITLRPDWESVKDNYMYEVLMAKFGQNPDLAKKLIDTGDAYLEEGTMWHDNYWGNCHCDKCAHIEGKNQLGKTLMRVRDELKKTVEQ